jgi:BirA family transcriptional regulator, biotin operon repressor / biotin---[acetyl-CoA-carboxylase] ligase
VELDQTSINSALTGGYWSVRSLEEIDSTQNALKNSSPKHGDVIVTNYQSAGRGRLDRRFEARPGTALLFSSYIEPRRPREEWGFIPLIVGLSVAEVLGIEFYTKWPNDILSDFGKVGGILCEVHGDGIVIGIGLNVSITEEELPVPTASSILLTLGSAPDRNQLLVAILKEIAFNIAEWESGEDLIDDYLDSSATMGKRVSVQLPNGEQIVGTATGISENGELLLESGAVISVGDIVHLSLS